MRNRSPRGRVLLAVVLAVQAISIAGSPGAGSPAPANAPPEPAGKTDATVSADLLRHPVSGNVRRRLEKAFAYISSGNHTAAIAHLRETLTKYPDSAPFVHNLLGVEYVKTDQYAAAVDSLGHAVELLPRDAMTHFNFGLSLICAGDQDRAERELRRAVELDPGNARMQDALAHVRQPR